MPIERTKPTNTSIERVITGGPGYDLSMHNIFIDRTDIFLDNQMLPATERTKPTDSATERTKPPDTAIERTKPTITGGVSFSDENIFWDSEDIHFDETFGPVERTKPPEQ